MNKGQVSIAGFKGTGSLKTLGKLLLWLVGLSVVALGAVAFFIATVDPNEHRDWIEARFYQQTGRAISLNGPVAFTLYPWLGVEAANVGIADSEEFGAGSFAQLDYVKLRVKSLPLLREQYEVDTVIIRGAALNLLRNEEGAANWEAFIGDPEDKDEPLLPLAALALGGVAIEEASITYEDRREALRYEFSELDVSTAELKYGEPVDLRLSLRGSSNKPALDAMASLRGIITYATDGQRFAIAPLELKADINSENIPGGKTSVSLLARVDADLDENTAALSDFTFAALDATVAGNLSAERIDSDAPAVYANLDAQGSDLALLFRLAEIEPLASQLAQQADRSFRVRATLDAELERGDIDLSELSAQLLGAELSGELQARNIHSDTPGYSGELNAAGPDLPTLLQVLGQLQGGDEAGLSGYARKLAGVPTPAFSVAAVFDADLKRGDIAMPVFSLDALGISARGKLDASDIRRGKGTVAGNLSLKGNRPGALLRALDQPELAEMLQSLQLDASVRGGKAGIVLEPVSLEVALAGTDLPGSAATLALNADARLKLDDETLAPEEITLEPMSLEVALAGTDLPDSAANLRLNADTRLHLADATLSLHGFTLQGLGLNASGAVDVTDMFDEPSVAGQLDIAPFDLRRLAQQLEQELPDTAADDTFTSMALSGRFDLSDDRINMERMELQLDDTRMSGEFSMDVDESGSVVRFDLDVDQIDLDRYLSPETDERHPAPAAGTGNEALLLPFVAMAATDLDGSLSIDRLRVAKMRLDGFAMRMNARAGVLQIDPVTASLYEGQLAAALKLNLNAALPRLTLNSALTDIQAEPLLMDVKGNARLRGKGNFTADLSAEGASVAALKRSLSGPMSISFTEGAVAGFNLGRALRQWKQFRRGGVFGAEDSVATDFTEITANPVAQAGIIRMDDLALRAPAFRLSGNGVLANLHNDTIDYQARAAVVNTEKGAFGEELAALQGLTLPIEVNGALDDPKIRLVWEKILAGLLVNRVIDALDLEPIKSRTPEESETGQETEEETEIDLLQELLKEGLKGIFRNN